jgi:hypothetical protein
MSKGVDWTLFFRRWKKRYQHDPVAFMREVLEYEPDPWQADVARAVATNKWVTVRSGQGVGKTALEAALLLWFLMTQPFPRVVCTAPTGQQLRDVLWSEAAKWQAKSKLLSKLLKWTKTYIFLKGMEKRWFAVARVAVRPENMQGFHEDNMLFIVDEASGVRDEIMEAILGTLTGPNNKLLMCGNPTRPYGIFFDSHHGTRGDFKTFQVNAENSPRTSKENIEALAKAYGKDSNVYRVRVLGEFPVSEDDAFISLTSVEAAIATEPDKAGEITFGVDVARYGNDKTIIAVKEGNDLTLPIKRHGQNLMQTVGDIVQLYRTTLKERPDYRGKITVYVDDTGLGGGVTDRLIEVKREEKLRYMEIVPVNFGSRVPDKDAAENFDNMGTWLWANLREELRLGRLSFPDDTELVAQLSSRKYSLTSAGRIILESKDYMKKRGVPSPDIGDAVALACYNDTSKFDINALRALNS